MNVLGNIGYVEIPSTTKQVLMGDPRYYEVSYAINKHMIDDNGELKNVSPSEALRQWLNLKREFENYGLEVSVVPAAVDLPDLVFTANQSLCLPDGQVLLSKMKSEERKAEVDIIKTWYQEQNISNLYQMENVFEGMGDLIWHPGKKLFWGGYGFRTEEAALKEMHQVTSYSIICMKLQMEEFYHLDTCFSILDENTVAFYPEAFDSETVLFIEGQFSRVIKIDKEEAIFNFAGNCYCPDGKNVFLQRNSKKFEKELYEFGFNPVGVDTSEFIKGGGSVFCMKLPLFF